MSQQRRIGDAPVAQRIGNHIALVVSHEQLAESERRAVAGVERRSEESDASGGDRNNRNKSLAAKRLGITRTQLYGRLHKYGLDSPAHS